MGRCPGTGCQLQTPLQLSLHQQSPEIPSPLQQTGHRIRSKGSGKGWPWKTAVPGWVCSSVSRHNEGRGAMNRAAGWTVPTLHTQRPPVWQLSSRSQQPESCPYTRMPICLPSHLPQQQWTSGPVEQWTSCPPPARCQKVHPDALAGRAGPGRGR